MADRYFTDHWNPVVGCSPVSPGCDGCTGITPIIGRMADPRGRRLLPTVEERDGVYRWTGVVVDTPDADSLRVIGAKRGRPRRVLVGPNGDLFHPAVSEAAIAGAFELMAGPYRRHTFLVLTKRPERMSVWLAVQPVVAGLALARRLPNVWLGVSVENQEYAAVRLPELLKCDTPRLFAVVEPMLGPVDLRRWMVCGAGRLRADPRLASRVYQRPTNRQLRWVVAAGEVGGHARSLDTAWLVGLGVQCLESGVPLWIDRLGAAPVARGARLPHLTTDPHHSRPEGWPESLRLRQLPAGMP